SEQTSPLPCQRTYIAVHGSGACHNPQSKDSLHRRSVAEPTKMQQQFGQKVAQRAIDIEEGIAVAKGKIRAPARPPDAILYQAIELEKKVDVVAGIIGPPEVAGL